MSEQTQAPLYYKHRRTYVTAGRTVPEHYERMVDFMLAYRKKNGYMPSNREMVDAGFATSTSVVRFYYDEMSEYNMIERDKGIARAIRILPRAKWGKKPEKKGEANE